jgi:hypothetical protein
MAHGAATYWRAAGLALALLPWALLGGGAGCLGGSTPPPATELCPPTALPPTVANASGIYVLDSFGEVVDARGRDWVGQDSSAVELQGSEPGCFQGGGIMGTWNPASSWETFHLTAAVSVRNEGQPTRVHAIHTRNYGDSVSIEPYVRCPNGSFKPWLYVRASHLEDVHDDAIEADGLCAVEISDNLIERAFVAFAFRNRTSEPDRRGSGNTVVVDGNLVRLHAFAQNYDGSTMHGAFWKWAHERRGPQIAVRNNRFLAFDPAGGLFPYVNRVTSCQNNVLLFAGTEAEWSQALLAGCDDQGDDGLCDGERAIALSDCFTVITKADSQSEADFLATHWDPHVASWKATHVADGE